MVLDDLPLTLDPGDRDFDAGDAFKLALNIGCWRIGDGPWLGLILLLLPGQSIDLHPKPVGGVNDGPPPSPLPP